MKCLSSGKEAKIRKSLQKPGLDRAERRQQGHQQGLTGCRLGIHWRLSYCRNHHHSFFCIHNLTVQKVQLLNEILFSYFPIKQGSKQANKQASKQASKHVRNQSINQSIDRSIDQSINQSTDRLINLYLRALLLKIRNYNIEIIKSKTKSIGGLK